MGTTLTTSALVKRINRRLPDGRRLRIARQWCSDLGDFYLVDPGVSVPAACHVDVIELARELGALGPHEVIADLARSAE